MPTWLFANSFDRNYMSDQSQKKKKTSESKEQNSKRKEKGLKNTSEPKKPWSILFWLSLALLLFYLLPLNNDDFSNAEKLTLKTLRSDLENFNVERVIFSNGEISWKLSKDGLPPDRKESNKARLITDLPDDMMKLIDEKVENGLEQVPPDIWVIMLLNWGPWIIFSVLLYVFFFRQIRSAGGGGLFNFGKSKARLVSPENINKTFADVAGVDEAKEELTEIVEFLKDPAKFTKLGGRLPHGMLLYGPPGTGKTLLAKAIAGEAGVPFYSISGSDFVEMFVGVGASRVRDLFHQAKENSPAIIFLDEIDAVGRKRGSGLGGGHDEREQTLNAILVEMDGFGSDDGVIVIASTNRVDVLDPALLRPGRFDRHVAVGLPDIEGRKEILKVHSRKIKLAEDANLDSTAQGTPGFSGAELENLLNEAALIAVAKDHKAVYTEDIEAARDKVAFGKEKKSHVMHKDDLKITAYHESGHALVSLKIPKATPLHKLTIIPRGNYLGAAFYLPERDETHRGRDFLLGQIAIAYGGRIAEETFCDDITTGASNDIQQASNIARKMVMEWGMSEKLGLLNYETNEERMFLGGEISRSASHSEKTSELIDKEVNDIMKACYEKAKSIIVENQEVMHRIANHLLDYETLTGDEVRLLVEGKELERKPPVKQVIRNAESEKAKAESSSAEEKIEGKEKGSAVALKNDKKDLGTNSGNIETSA